MTLEELKAWERERYEEYRKIEKLYDAAGMAWLAVCKEIEQREKQTEIERLVEERLAAIKQEVV